MTECHLLLGYLLEIKYNLILKIIFIEMNKLIFTALLFLSACVYSNSADSTLNIDLNFDSRDETVKLKYIPDNLDFSLTINNQSVTGVFMDAYAAEIEILDIDKNDGLREIVVKGYGSSDQTECFFYQFRNGKIAKCGYLPSNLGIKADGSKILKETNWMGFYSLEIKYEFDSRAGTLTPVTEELYEVNIPAEVKEEIVLLKYRNDDSERSAVLKPGTKITLLKTDITPACEYGTDARFDMMCDWFLIKTYDGREGWIRLNMFNEKIEGLIWAG